MYTDDQWINDAQEGRTTPNDNNPILFALWQGKQVVEKPALVNQQMWNNYQYWLHKQTGK